MLEENEKDETNVMLTERVTTVGARNDGVCVCRKGTMKWFGRPGALIYLHVPTTRHSVPAVPSSPVLLYPDTLRFTMSVFEVGKYTKGQSLTPYLGVWERPCRFPRDENLGRGRRTNGKRAIDGVADATNT